MRTAKVRGVTERYWGRTARRFELDDPARPSLSGATTILRTVAAELEAGDRPAETDMVALTRARLPPRSPATRR